MIGRLWWRAHVDGARLDEAEQLAEIHRAGFRRTWSAHDFQTMMRDPSVFVLALRLQLPLGARRLAGFVTVRFAADEAEILTIAVAPRYRGRGYGRMLMDDVIRRLYRERIARLFLEVDRANRAAVRLYQRLGFAVAGERRNYYAEPTAGDGTALVMRLQVR
ncbi:MAG TPA: ribosomal protein S18-alanine N-acetyltransferase [Bauldia sp.]|nr:ribosomal protein S18-alanine N-acetyltransferase [Bauldia sp.]